MEVPAWQMFVHSTLSAVKTCRYYCYDNWQMSTNFNNSLLVHLAVNYSTEEAKV